MKSLLHVFLLLAFCSVSYCGKAVDFGENEVDVDETKQAKYASDGDQKAQIEERQKLINYLFNQGFDKRNYPTNTTITVGLAIVKLDVDELKSTLETDVWVRMAWNDSRLKWDEKEFDVKVLRMKSQEIWTPDITLYNSASPSEMMKCWDSNTLIYPNGEVLWVPPCHLSSLCNFTLNTDPYGPQQCILKFGSWTFDGLSQDLQIFNKNETKADLSDLWDITQWEITSNDAIRTEKYYPCCVEPYPDIIFNLTVQRKQTPNNHVPCNL